MFQIIHCYTENGEERRVNCGDKVLIGGCSTADYTRQGITTVDPTSEDDPRSEVYAFVMVSNGVAPRFLSVSNAHETMDVHFNGEALAPLSSPLWDVLHRTEGEEGVAGRFTIACNGKVYDFDVVDLV